MIRTQTAIALASAVLLVLAGCTGGVGSAPTDDVGTTATSDASDSDGEVAGSTGMISFYLSDKPSAIDDFEHLNVTITKVGFHRVGTTETDTPMGTTTPNETTTANETTIAETSTTTTPSTATLTAETESSGDDTTTPIQTPEPEDNEESQDREQDEETAGDQVRDGDQEREQDRDGDGQWVTEDVNDTTVDLTGLQGANATKLDVLEVPPSTYDKVFIYVGDINATLKNGEQVRVKLPSERLQVNERFTVGDDDAIDFVFDVSVFEAGKSGKYILKPVVSQTGTGDKVEIDPVDGADVNKTKDAEANKNEDGDENNEAADGEGGEERKGEENETAPEKLAANLRGPVKPGQTVTVAVAQEGNPVANATVVVNEERVGTTDGDGTLEIEVPTDTEEIEIEITKGRAKLEIEREIRGGGGSGGNGNNG